MTNRFEMDSKEWRIGRLALVTGELAIFDLSVMQTAWGLDHVKNALKQATAVSVLPGARQERRKAQKLGIDNASSTFDAGLSMLKASPHATLATIRVNGRCVWSSLRADGLIIPASDLMIKHGVHVAGPWSMIGVVDAFPDEDESDDKIKQRHEAAASSLGALGAFIGSLGPLVRGMLGRPKDAHGMTPLLIFREVSG